MEFQNKIDEQNVAIAQFARGETMTGHRKAFDTLLEALPSGTLVTYTEINTAPGENYYELTVAEPIHDWPLPGLTGERTVDYGRYTVQKPWPVDTHMNGGGNGLVVVRGAKDSYHTAFFEASPRSPNTFIRGEGESIEAAEESAWAKYQRYTAGDHEHEFETRGYTNGAGFCKHCGMFSSKVFSLQEIGVICVACGAGGNAGKNGEHFYCLEHDPSELGERIRKMRADEPETYTCTREELIEFFNSDE